MCQAIFIALLLAMVPVSRIGIWFVGTSYVFQMKVLTCNSFLWALQLQKAQGGHEINTRASHCVRTYVHTSPLLHKSPSPHGIPEKRRPALVTDPILLGPLCVLAASASKHFMQESGPITFQGPYKRLLDIIERQVSCH